VIGSLLLEFVDGVEEVVSEGGGREGRGEESMKQGGDVGGQQGRSAFLVGVR
jgi:hypothetical protein